MIAKPKTCRSQAATTISFARTGAPVHRPNTCSASVASDVKAFCHKESKRKCKVPKYPTALIPNPSQSHLAASQQLDFQTLLMIHRDKTKGVLWCFGIKAFVALLPFQLRRGTKLATSAAVQVPLCELSKSVMKSWAGNRSKTQDLMQGSTKD